MDGSCLWNLEQFEQLNAKPVFRRKFSYNKYTLRVLKKHCLHTFIHFSYIKGVTTFYTLRIISSLSLPKIYSHVKTL